MRYRFSRSVSSPGRLVEEYLKQAGEGLLRVLLVCTLWRNRSLTPLVLRD